MKNFIQKISWGSRVFIVFWLVNIAWIFFRTGIAQSWYTIRSMFVGIGSPLTYFGGCFQQMNMTAGELARMAIFILLLLIYDFIELKRDVIQMISESKKIYRWTLYYTIGFCILIWGVKASSTAFIYFQF